MVNILPAIASQCVGSNKMNPFLLYPHLLSPNTYLASLLNNGCSKQLISVLLKYC